MTAPVPADPAAWLEEIFAPVGSQSFVAEVAGRAVRHLPGRPSRFGALFGWDDLSRLLEWTPLQPPRIEFLRAGREEPAEQFFTRDDPPLIDAGRVSLALEQGATLRINAIDQVVPKLAALGEALAQAFGMPIGANLYASWKAESGLSLHWDTHGVLVLQLAGRKQWTIHAPTHPDPVPGLPFEPPPHGAEPVWSGMLEDGDVLYLPRGYPHIASALDGASMHLTIALSEPTGIGFLEWLVGPLREHAALRAALPPGDDAEVDERWLADVRAIVGSALTRDALRDYRAFNRAAMPTRPHFELPGFARPAPSSWTGQTQLRLSSKRGLAPRRLEDGTVRISFLGREFPCGPAVASAASRLSSAQTTALSELERDLAPAESAELRRLLTLMMMGGALFAS